MKKKIFFVPAAIAAITLAACGKTPEPGPEPGPTEYTITSETAGVEIKPSKATEGTDYEGKINVTAEGKILTKLDSVILNDASKTDITSDCTFTIASDELSADFKIPAKDITSDIVVKVTLEAKPEPIPDVKVTLVSKSLNISCDSTKKDNDLVATISLKESYESKYNLPATLGYIQVKEAEDISYTDYTYKPEFNASSATLTIPGRFITNDITITAEAKLVEYKVLFTQSAVFTSETKSVGKKQPLDMNFKIKDEYTEYVKFPEDLIVTIGESTEPLTEFTYDKDDKTNVAQLKIDSKYINGDIKIASTAMPETKKATIVDANKKLALTDSEFTIGEPFETTIYSTDKTHFFLPQSLTKVSYHDGEKDVEIKKYTYKPSDGKLIIDDVLILGDLTIKADSIEQDWHTLSVKTSADESKLTFTHGETSITEQKPYSFDYIVIKEDEYFVIDITCGEHYAIPKTLEIECGKTPIPKEKYKVEYVGEGTEGEDKTKATLSIATEAMKGDVYIEASAIKVDTINIEPILVGVEADFPRSIERLTGEINCYIGWDETKHRQPAGDNVLVRITNKEGNEIWYNGFGEGSDKSIIDIKYNPEASVLVIPNSVVKELAPYSTIVIAIKARDVSVLEELTRATTEAPEGHWDLVHRLSKYGELFFHIKEETSPFYVGDDILPYKARVIGINQEINDNGDMIKGLTLEFTSCVDIITYDDKDYYYYPDGGEMILSRPYKLLNDQDSGIYAYLPKDLRESIMPVSKKTYSLKAMSILSSTNYLFPLSLVEMNEGQFRSDDTFKNKYSDEASVKNEPYRYYKSITDPERLKEIRMKGYGLLDECEYWLRSTNLEDEYGNWCMATDGTTFKTKNIKGVAPAFCI